MGAFRRGALIWKPEKGGGGGGGSFACHNVETRKNKDEVSRGNYRSYRLRTAVGTAWPNHFAVFAMCISVS